MEPVITEGLAALVNELLSIEAQTNTLLIQQGELNDALVAYQQQYVAASKKITDEHVRLAEKQAAILESIQKLSSK